MKQKELIVTLLCSFIVFIDLGIRATPKRSIYCVISGVVMAPKPYKLSPTVLYKIEGNNMYSV